MICPRCNKDVQAVYGNGEYPNNSYRCDECHSYETTELIGAVLAVIIYGGLLVGVLSFLGC
jgi:hypothetical protein